MKVTIHDIAKMAGVSISTVSRVINNSKPVNEEVRMKVMEAIKQTNYRSGVAAGDGAKTDSALIGVIAPQFSQTVLNDMVAGIESVSRLYGYELLIGLTDGTLESELDHLRRFGNIESQGIIFVGSMLERRHTQTIEASGIPCVVIGQISNTPSIPSVHVDNITASYEAVTHLIQKGHRRIAMIRGIGDEGIGNDRYQGFRQAMNDAGLPVRREWVVNSALSVDDGMNAMRKLAETGEMPTAVFCSTDWMAIGAMNYVLDQGMRIPEDVAVFGFDGSYLSSIFRPKLSTVEYSATEIGMTATRNLIKMIKGASDIPQHSNVTHYLAIRESTN
ncbi:LacI family DNA-binding transcriptional regulator [Paenibacillus zanthoxyli]|uniref:LacI family DNA-binding transcriptional regulator n=1 Tax=Paenibacillus zanthoxyli TaxID=369399 RepID=UPI0004B6EB02|nr:LacI family DNA-binding transcriptional regulator [Paenibacillus zanthoxyli]